VGKKIKGRKRHIAVDTQGNLLAAIVHSAGIQDRVAARAVLMRLFCRFDTITTVFVDGGYTGTLIGWAKDMFGFTVKVGVISPPPQLSFHSGAIWPGPNGVTSMLCMSHLP
jgi:hypothetical protein